MKRKHFDLYLKTNIGRIQVEINTEKEGYVNPRNMAYLCDIYSHVTLIGEEYSEKLEVIQINFSYHLKDSKLLRIFYYQDNEHKKYVKNLRTYEVNMEKYMNYWYTNNKEEVERNKKIIMLDLELEELKEISEKDRLVKKYMEEIKRVNEDPKFREYMSAEEDNRKIENSIRTEFLKKGEEKGLKKGIQKGLEKGKREIVYSMLAQGLDISTISKYTNIEKTQIKKYQEEYQQKNLSK